MKTRLALSWKSFVPIAVSLLVIFPLVCQAVIFARDTVTVTQGGFPIFASDIIFVGNYPSLSDRCPIGYCTIPQNYYPVTFYKSKSHKKIQTFWEYDVQHPYMGGQFDGAAKDAWSAKNNAGYLQYLKVHSVSSAIFNPGSSPDDSHAINQLGTARSYIVDLTNGNYSRVAVFQTWIPFLWYIGLAIIILFIFIFCIRLLVWKMKHRNLPSLH